MRDSRSMPLPKIEIGMKVQPFELSAYHRKILVRSQISEHLNTARRLRKRGYLNRVPGDMKVLGNHAKEMIRAFMRVIDTAHTVEIAGIHGFGHHLGLSPVNECYVSGGPQWSGLVFRPQLLWRATVDGKELAVLQPLSSIPSCFLEREILERATKTTVAA